jgi:hypothetical protein
MKRDKGPRIGPATIAISVIYLGALYAVLSLWPDRPFYVTAVALLAGIPFSWLARWMRRTPPTQRGTVPPPITPGQ